MVIDGVRPKTALGWVGVFAGSCHCAGVQAARGQVDCKIHFLQEYSVDQQLAFLIIMIHHATLKELRLTPKEYFISSDSLPKE